MSEVKLENVTLSKILCNLHSESFTLYCDRCLQPVCQKCTFIGPHNTAIHSLLPIIQAYERRQQQLRSRLQKLSQTRQIALTQITKLTTQIQSNKIETQQIIIQNNKNQVQLSQRLQKSYQNILSYLLTEEQLIVEQLNDINDLGHQFQDISSTSDVECLINYQGIIEDLNQVKDRLTTLLKKQIVIDVLPKQLSQIRIKLKQIETYQEIFQQKLKILGAMKNKFNQQVSRIEAPKIQYQQKLEQINGLLHRFDGSCGEFNTSLQNPNIRKSHFVCHFCGIILNDGSINTQCTKNKMNEQLKNTQKYFTAINKIQIHVVGYCKKQPDLAKFGTHRHFFGEPIQPLVFYRVCFLGWILAKETVLPFFNLLNDNDKNLITVNEPVFKEGLDNSFANFISLLFLKIVTLARIKGKNIQQLFQSQDFNGNELSGHCNIIAMQYNLIENIGLSETESNIIEAINNFVDKNINIEVDVNDKNNEKKIKKQDLRNYQYFINQLKKITI